MKSWSRKRFIPTVLCMFVLFFSLLPVTSISAEEIIPTAEPPAGEQNALSEKTTPSGIPLSDLEGFVDGYVDDFIGKTVPGAAIVVLKDNEIVLSKGYGYADIEKKIEVNPETTVFEWGFDQ